MCTSLPSHIVAYLLLSSLYQREQKANGIHRYLFPLLRSEDVYVIDTNPNVIPLAHKLSPDYNANYTFQSLRIRTRDGLFRVCSVMTRCELALIL